MRRPLEIDEAEAGALRAILDRYLRDLSFEIADTDSSSYRGELKDHREVVRRVAAKLERFEEAGSDSDEAGRAASR